MEGWVTQKLHFKWWQVVYDIVIKAFQLLWNIFNLYAYDPTKDMDIQIKWVIWRQISDDPLFDKQLNVYFMFNI